MYKKIHTMFLFINVIMPNIILNSLGFPSQEMYVLNTWRQINCHLKSSWSNGSKINGKFGIIKYSSFLHNRLENIDFDDKYLKHGCPGHMEPRKAGGLNHLFRRIIFSILWHGMWFLKIVFHFRGLKKL